MLRGVKESKVKLILLYDAYNNSDLYHTMPGGFVFDENVFAKADVLVDEDWV